MVRGGRVKFVALNYDIVTDPYEVIASTLERPLTMPMYEQSKAKLKVVYDSLDQLGPFPVHDWYNGSLRKWLKKFGESIDWESTDKMYLFAIILADYMAAVHNVRGEKGEKSFLAFVIQILNWTDGIRQRSGWQFPIQVKWRAPTPPPLPPPSHLLITPPQPCALRSTPWERSRAASASALSGSCA
jgi:hypothetical protein